MLTQCSRKCRFFPVFFLPILLLIFSCNEKMVPASVTGYNHQPHFAIATFTVNGAVGRNLNEASGGGQSCCVSIPAKWHRGLQARVAWRYDQSQDDTSPLPPAQEAIVEIQEYKRPGILQVHFYENNRIKVIVSDCVIGHPFYPMSLQDQKPWSPEISKKEAIEIEKLGGGSNEC